MNSKSKKIAVAIIVIFIILLSIYFIIDKYFSPMSVNELYHNSRFWGDNLTLGDKCKIEDTVTKIKTFKMPGNIFGSGVDEYTAIWCKSNRTAPLLLLGNNTSEYFVDSKIKLEFEVKAYYTLSMPGVEIHAIEPLYVLYLITLDYSVAYLTYNYSTLTFSSEKAILNQTSAKYYFNITNVSSVYPLPLFWSNISIQNYYSNSSLVKPVVYLYDENGTFLGEISSECNYSLEYPISVDQHLEFVCDIEDTQNDNFLYFNFINEFLDNNLTPLCRLNLD